MKSVLTLSLLKQPKVASQKWPIFPRAAKSSHKKRVQKNVLYALGKAVFVNNYSSIVKGRHKPIKSHELHIQNYCMRRVVKGRSLDLPRRRMWVNLTHGICKRFLLHHKTHEKPDGWAFPSLICLLARYRYSVDLCCTNLDVL